jgi:hypothetical protein
LSEKVFIRRKLHVVYFRKSWKHFLCLRLQFKVTRLQKIFYQSYTNRICFFHLP